MTNTDENVEYVRPKYGAHPTHCCAQHGCKYGDADCPVEMEIVEQVYPCEDCSSPEELAEEIAELQEELEWALKLRNRKATS